MPTDEQIEQAAAIMFAASLAFTNTIGRKGWSWDSADDAAKTYWRNMAAHVWRVLNQKS